MFHKHNFVEIEPQGFGYWEKQPGQGNIVGLPGKIEKCQCGTMRIIPNDSRFRTVEVTR